MKQRIYQVDAFADAVFSGNPAAICPLDQWLQDDLMQKIAMENNLAETAFYVPRGSQYEIRWFTPAAEVDLCGHATLAAAFVLFNVEGHAGDLIQFHSHRSGALTVSKKDKLLTLNFPADTFSQVDVSGALKSCINIQPQSAFKGKTDYLLVYANEDEVQAAIPSFDNIAALDARGLIITAPGRNVDFVSRFFGPQVGVNEDHVTGSAHTTLTPYWAKRFGKNELTAIQLSARKGHLQCRYLGDRVEISGQAALYLSGEIYLA